MFTCAYAHTSQMCLYQRDAFVITGSEKVHKEYIIWKRIQRIDFTETTDHSKSNHPVNIHCILSQKTDLPETILTVELDRCHMSFLLICFYFLITIKIKDFLQFIDIILKK